MTGGRAPAAAPIEALTRAALHPALRPHGFRRRGRTWNRAAGQVTHVVNLQVSQWSDGAVKQFTINLGVFVPASYRVLRDRPPPAWAGEADCAVRKRLGHLMTGQRDRWWTLTPAVDPGLVGREVTAAVLAHGLPFLDRLTDPRSVRAALASAGSAPNSTPLARLELAILTAQQGDRAEAAQLLRQLVAGTGQRLAGWRESVAQVAERLGLDLGE